MSLMAYNSSLKYEMNFVFDGAAIIARWGIMQKWMHKQTHKWNPVDAEKQYRVVKNAQARLNALHPPIFEDFGLLVED